MNNATITLKIKQRLNKLASSDYDNLQCWQIVEAFNKGQSNWCRRNLHGLNLKNEGDEASKRRIDDLQVLLLEKPIILRKKKLFYDAVLPENYLQWKRIRVKGKTDCCEGVPMMVYLGEEANVESFLRDENKKPSLDWSETFCTLINKTVRVYTNDEFNLEEAHLIYYRQPRKIEIVNCSDPYTFQVSTSNVECEFNEDLIELFIDEAVKILAGDIESLNQQQIATNSVENNN